MKRREKKRKWNQWPEREGIKGNSSRQPAATRPTEYSTEAIQLNAARCSLNYSTVQYNTVCTATVEPPAEDVIGCDGWRWRSIRTSDRLRL